MRRKADRIAQAIGDPGSIAGRKMGPSWGAGNEGYAAEEESVTRWSTRAVLAVLAAQDAEEAFGDLAGGQEGSEL